MAAFNFQSGGRNTPRPSEEAAAPPAVWLLWRRVFRGAAVPLACEPEGLGASSGWGRQHKQDVSPPSRPLVFPLDVFLRVRGTGAPSGGLKLNTLASTCTNSRSCTTFPPPHTRYNCVVRSGARAIFVLFPAAASPSVEPAAFRLQDQTVSCSW